MRAVMVCRCTWHIATAEQCSKELVASSCHSDLLVLGTLINGEGAVHHPAGGQWERIVAAEWEQRKIMQAAWAMAYILSTLMPCKVNTSSHILLLYMTALYKPNVSVTGY